MASQYIQEMVDKARFVMANAYAPYSKFNVGACVRSTDGQYFIGCNVENASYGLTQCAESCAIGNMVAGGVTKISDILVVSDDEEMCPTCGACRQVLREFSSSDTLIHLVDGDNNILTKTMAEFLPESFGPENLKDFVKLQS